jgi:hypothetical protein
MSYTAQEIDKFIEKTSDIAEKELGPTATHTDWKGYEVLFKNTHGKHISINEKTFEVTHYEED